MADPSAADLKRAIYPTYFENQVELMKVLYAVCWHVLRLNISINLKYMYLKFKASGGFCP